MEEKFGPQARADASRPTWRPASTSCVDDGLVTFDGTVLRVTPLGQLLVRNVAMLFDAYLKKGARGAQFSRTV